MKARGQLDKQIPRDKYLLKKIGLVLKEKRKANGYKNSDDFAYEHHINRSQYGKYEAGSTDMQITTLANVVNELGLTLDELFQEVNKVAIDL